MAHHGIALPPPIFQLSQPTRQTQLSPSPSRRCLNQQGLLAHQVPWADPTNKGDMKSRPPRSILTFPQDGAVHHPRYNCVPPDLNILSNRLQTNFFESVLHCMILLLASSNPLRNIFACHPIRRTQFEALKELHLLWRQRPAL